MKTLRLTENKTLNSVFLIQELQLQIDNKRPVILSINLLSKDLLTSQRSETIELRRQLTGMNQR